MTKLSNIKQYIASLKDIEDIMSAMNNISFIELNKVTKYLEMQKKILVNLEDIGIDFFSFNQNILPENYKSNNNIYVLIGSERGFCGNFNEKIISYWEDLINTNLNKNIEIIVIGNKLADKISDSHNINHVIKAPSFVEEIPSAINKLLDYLKNKAFNNLSGIMPIDWNVIFNEIKNNKIEVNSLNLIQNLFTLRSKVCPYKLEPKLNISVDDFLFEYLEQYSLMLLHYMFYQSLMAESESRIEHLNNAKSLINKECDGLFNKMNLLRQEEITEEIENILLSVPSFYDFNID